MFTLSVGEEFGILPIIFENNEKIIKIDLSHPRARGQDVFLKYRTQILEILNYAGKVQEVEYAI